MQGGFWYHRVRCKALFKEARGCFAPDTFREMVLAAPEPRLYMMPSLCPPPPSPSAVCVCSHFKCVGARCERR